MTQGHIEKIDMQLLILPTYAMFFVEIILSWTVLPFVFVLRRSLGVARHHVRLGAKNLPSVLGHKLNNPHLLLRVYHTGQSSWALACPQQGRAEHYSKKKKKYIV